jgi:hypothetical protein
LESWPSQRAGLNNDGALGLNVHRKAISDLGVGHLNSRNDELADQWSSRFEDRLNSDASFRRSRKHEKY